MTTRKSRFAALGLLLLVLASGAAIGVVVERTWLGAGRATKLTDKERVERLLAKFKKDLTLDAAQEAQMREVMSKGRAAVNAIVARVDPEVQSTRQKTREEITKLLTPAQAERYREMVKRYQAKKAAEAAGNK